MTVFGANLISHEIAVFEYDIESITDAVEVTIVGGLYELNASCAQACYDCCFC